MHTENGATAQVWWEFFSGHTTSLFPVWLISAQSKGFWSEWQNFKRLWFGSQLGQVRTQPLTSLSPCFLMWNREICQLSHLSQVMGGWGRKVRTSTPASIIRHRTGRLCSWRASAVTNTAYLMSNALFPTPVPPLRGFPVPKSGMTSGKFPHLA